MNNIKIFTFWMVFFIGWACPSFSQISPQVNKGHRKSIQCAAFWTDKDAYATAGSDLTIKIWDFKTNKVLKNLESHKYNISAIAAYEKEGRKYLVSGGIYELKIWDVKKGYVIKDIYIQGSVKCIKMSRSGDGFYFSLDKQIKKYDFAKGYATAVVNMEKDIVSFDVNAAEDIFYVASEYKVEKVDVKNGDNHQVLSRNTSGKIVEIDLSYNDKWLVAAGFYDIVVWDVLTQTEPEPWVIDQANASACFDSKSEKLFARKNQEALIYVFDVANKKIVDSTEPPKYVPTMAICNTNLDGLLFGYGYNDFLFWETSNMHSLRENKNLLPSIEDMTVHQNKLIFGVGSKGKIGVFDMEKGTFEKFNSRQYERVNGVESIGPDQFISISHDGTVAINSIKQKGKVASINFDNPEDTTVREKVNYEEEDRMMYTMKMLSRKNLIEYAYIPSEKVLAAASAVDMELIDLDKRKRLDTLVGHNDYIRNISLSHNGKYLLTASLDKTAKLWDISNRKVLINYFGHTNRVFDAIFSNDDQYVLTGCADGKVRVFKTETGEFVRNGAFNQDEIYDIALSPNGSLLVVAGRKGLKVWDWQNATLKFDLSAATIEFRDVKFLNDHLLVSRNKNDEIQFFSLEKGLIGQLIVTDYEDLGFVFFTPDGYYMGDKKSVAENIHFVYNDEVYLFEQFDLYYNRPDIILEKLAIANTNYIDILKVAHEKRIRKLGLDVNTFKSGPILEVPSVRLLNAAFYEVVNSPNYLLEYEVKSKNHFIDQVCYVVNVVPSIQKHNLKVKSLLVKDKFDIYLSPGKNIIEVYASNANGAQSLKERIEVVYEPTKLVKPNLYVITIGAAQFEQSQMNLRYAAKDASDLINLFSKENQAFGKVNTLSLINEEVDRSIFDQMNKFIKKAAINDQLIIMVSGHGVFDEEYDYYIATYDTDFSNPTDKAIPYNMFEKFLSETTIRNKVLFLDACHSGEIDKEEVELAELAAVEDGDVTFRSFGNKTVQSKRNELGLQNSFEIQKEMFNDLRNNNGTNVISAAGGTEFAMEGDLWKNGVFTYAFINGIQTKTADLDGNGRVILSELQTYLQDKVVQLTKGRQTPTSRTVNLQNDFTIWKY